MDFTCIFFGILFTIAGFVFACGKGHIHLSEWKNMPQEEKDKIKIIPLCRNIGEVIALNGIEGALVRISKPLVCMRNDCMANRCGL